MDKPDSIKNPRGRIEQGAAYIADLLENSTPPVTVEALSVTANGEYATTGKAFSPVTVAVPNPNTVETVTGTLGNPWGSYTYSEIVAMVQSPDYTVQIYVPGYSPTPGIVIYQGSHLTSYLADDGGATFTEGFITDWDENGVIISVLTWVATPYSGAYMENLTLIADTYPCALQIVHHPLPSNI